MQHIAPTPTPCACTALRKATRLITRRYDERLAPHAMTTTQFALLRHIARAGEIGLSQLAEQLVMDRTSLYRCLRPAEAAGWVATRPAPRGHVRLASLTEAGRAAMHAATPAWEACQAEIRAGLGEAGWQGLFGAAQAVLALGAAA